MRSHPPYAGFHADLNETYPVGTVDADSLRVMRTSRKCLDAAIAICKPGALFRDIGKVMSVSPSSPPPPPLLPSSLTAARQRAARAPERLDALCRALE